MKNIVCIFSMFICINMVFAQAPAIQWQNTIGGSDYEIAQAVIQTSDGGYMVGGYSRSSISGDKTENALGEWDYWVVKLNAAGAIQWQNTIGGSNFDTFSSLYQTSDGGYILGGSSRSPISGDKTENSFSGTDDYWVVKLDASGAIQWQNTIGGTGSDGLSDIIQTADGGYIIGGNSGSGISGDKTEAAMGGSDYWVVKLNAAGVIQWQNTIGGSGNDAMYSIRQTSDGGYILGGQSNSGISGDKTEANLGEYDYWVVKISSTGTLQWQNTIGGSTDDILYSVSQTSDGGYILAGHSESGISGDKTEASMGLDDYWIIKLNSTGVIQWQNTIGGNSYDTYPHISQTADGGYILAGNSLSGLSGDKTEASMGSSDYWVLKLTSTGTILWQNAIGGTSTDDLWSMSKTSDNGYVLLGNSQSGISGDKTEANLGSFDYWVVKLGPECTAPSVSGFTINDNEVCNGDPVTLTITGSLNDAEYWSIYSGTCGGILVDTISSASLTLHPSASATYFVRGEGGCTSPGTCSSVSVTVHSLPNVSAGTDSSICAGDAIDISATGAVTYLWDNGLGSDNPATIHPPGTTTYIVAGTDANGCVDTDTLTVTVNPLPNTFAGNDTLICPGNNANLFATGASTYNWIGLSSANPQTVSPNSNTTYVVTGFSTEGCRYNDTVVVSVSVLPTLSFHITVDSICTSYAPVSLSATPSGGVFSGPGISGAQIQPAVAGPGLHTIMYTFTNTDGCVTDTSDMILISPCLGMEDDKMTEILIYPNPANDYIMVQSSLGFDVLEIMDVTGKVVFNTVTGNTKEMINTSILVPGIYFIRINLSGKSVVHKIIKE